MEPGAFIAMETMKQIQNLHILLHLLTGFTGGGQDHIDMGVAPQHNAVKITMQNHGISSLL